MNQVSGQWRFVDSYVHLDSGGNFHDDLARFYHSEQFDQEERKQLASRSAARFFGL